MKRDKNKHFDMKDVAGKLSSYIGLGVLVLLILSLANGISKIKQVNLKIEKDRERVEDLKREKEELQKELEKVQSEEFMEKQLRDKLGMAKEGEIVVILPDAEEVKKFAPRIDEEEEILPDPNWKKWAKLFGLLN